MSAVPLAQQAQEARLLTREHDDHCKAVAVQVAKGKRPQHDLDRKREKGRAYHAIAATLTALERCADEVRPIIAKNMGQADAV
jgi:hypothetical protein